MMAPNKTDIISSLLLHVRHHHIDKNTTLHQKKRKRKKKPMGTATTTTYSIALPLIIALTSINVITDDVFSLSSMVTEE